MEAAGSGDCRNSYGSWAASCCSPTLRREGLPAVTGGGHVNPALNPTPPRRPGWTCVLGLQPTEPTAQPEPWTQSRDHPRAPGNRGRASTQQGYQSCRKAAPGLGVLGHPQTSRSSRVTLSPPGPRDLQIPPNPEEPQGDPESIRASGSSDTPRPQEVPGHPESNRTPLGSSDTPRP